MNGTLDSVMERMAGHYDKEYKLRNKVTSASVSYTHLDVYKRQVQYYQIYI